MSDRKQIAAEERDGLLRMASQAAAQAYAPYSGFRVGAAVLGDKGTYTGANVENGSYGLGLCAERAALAAAISAGDKNIRAIAIACVDASPDSSAEFPCGACRQWIVELAPQAELFILGHAETFRIADLLPNPFKFKARS